MSFGSFQTEWLPCRFPSRLQYFQLHDNLGMSYKSKFCISALSVASRTWHGRWKQKKKKKGNGLRVVHAEMDIISGGILYAFFNLIYKNYTIFLQQTTVYQTDGKESIQNVH